MGTSQFRTRNSQVVESDRILGHGAPTGRHVSEREDSGPLSHGIHLATTASSGSSSQSGVAAAQGLRELATRMHRPATSSPVSGDNRASASGVPRRVGDATAHRPIFGQARSTEVAGVGFGCGREGLARTTMQSRDKTAMQSRDNGDDKRGRSLTIPPTRLTKGEIAEGIALAEYMDYRRPQTRGECVNGQRPCPYGACKHDLYLDVNPVTGSIKINFPDVEVWEMQESCALDIAERGGQTLEEVGAIMNLTRERIRQVEVSGLERLQAEEFAVDLEDVFTS